MNSSSQGEIIQGKNGESPDGDSIKGEERLRVGITLSSASCFKNMPIHLLVEERRYLQQMRKERRLEEAKTEAREKTLRASQQEQMAQWTK